MKRSRPEKTRLMLQAGMVAVVGLALLLVVCLPPYGWEATLSSAHTAPGDPDGNNIVTSESSVTFGQMQQYLVSLQNESTAKDPFLSAGETQWKVFLRELKERPPRLAGIINIGGTPAVLVQGSHYRVGDTVQSFLVLDIKKNAVVFLKDGRQFVVPLTH